MEMEMRCSVDMLGVGLGSWKLKLTVQFVVLQNNTTDSTTVRGRNSVLLHEFTFILLPALLVLRVFPVGSGAKTQEDFAFHRTDGNLALWAGEGTKTQDELCKSNPAMKN